MASSEAAWSVPAPWVPARLPPTPYAPIRHVIEVGIR
jgi:hypothetical protein